MTWPQQAAVIGRQACVVVELLLDFCQLRFGQGRCQATLAGPGLQCFNTASTCQFLDAYTPTGKSYRFTNTRINAPDIALPILRDIKFAGTVIDPGKGLGIRASVSAQFEDFPSGDTDVDPYFRSRTYYPGKQGTYFGKLLARNPYYQNRLMRVYSGYLVDGVFDESNFDVRTYAIQDIQGPDQNYMVTVTAKDILKLADDKRAQAPNPCGGSLLANIGPTDTTFTVQPAGIGDIDYDGQGSIVIAGEVMTYVRSSDIFTVVRAQNNTVAVKHDAKATVQQCLVYTNAYITNVIYDLLTNIKYAYIPTNYIDLDAWNAEANLWLSETYVTTVIPKPTGINSLITELTNLCLCYIWWDERAQLIQFKAIRPARATEITNVNELNNLIKDSVSLSDQPAQRLSEVYVYYGQIDPTLPLTRTDNFDYQYAIIDAAAESAIEYGEARIKTIPARWFTVNNAPQVASLGFRMLQRYRDNPKIVTFTLDAKDASIWTGDFITLQTQVFQDVYGNQPVQQMEVLSVEETEVASQYKYTAVLSVFNKRYGFIGPNTLVPYTSDTTANHNLYAWIANNNSPPTMSNGDSAYYII
jgi:hypothetical protein